MKKLRVAIYARVSTKDVKKTKTATGQKDKQQDPENQLAQLREWCDVCGHEIVAEYVERESGRKGAEDRKQLAALLADAHQRKFDLVLFWKLDRFSREGMAKTIGYLQRLASAGVAFRSHTEEFLSTDNELVRDILLAVMATLAKQEAIKISDNTKIGLERARAEGKTLGRPKASDAVLAAIAEDRVANPEMSLSELARRHGVSRTVVRKAIAN